MYLPRAIAAVTAVVFAGCATPEQLAVQKAQEVDRLVQVYGPACDKLGYKGGTDQWRNCLLQLSIKDDLAYHNFSRYNYYGPYGPYGPYWMY